MRKNNYRLKVFLLMSGLLFSVSYQLKAQHIPTLLAHCARHPKDPQCIDVFGPNGPGPGFPGNPNPIELPTAPTQPGTRPPTPVFPVFPTDPHPPGYVDLGGSSNSMKEVFKNNPFGLMDPPCDVVKKWLAIAKFKVDETIYDKLRKLYFSETVMLVNGEPYDHKDIARVQKIDDAYSTVVNMDYFPVTVDQLPMMNGQRLTPGEFLHHIRTHMNDFTDGTKTFNPYNGYKIDDRQKWFSNDPKGAIVGLDISGPDNASVITSYSASDKWTFTTIHEPMYGDHPVSGNRDFGYTPNSDGSFTFYTKGVDRLTSWDGVVAQKLFNIPFSAADNLWKNFQNKIKDFSNNNGGSAKVNEPVISRPNWDKVKDVMNGKRPLSDLSKNCPD